MVSFRPPKPFVHAAAACLVGLLMANAAEAAGAEYYELHIRPSICVSYTSDEPCGMTLHISWEGSGTQAVCLKTSTDDAYIRCWNGESAGNLTLDWENDSNVVYRLVSMQNNRILAEKEVQVISRDLRESRRRRRHVWSIL